MAQLEGKVVLVTGASRGVRERLQTNHGFTDPEPASPPPPAPEAGARP